MFNVLNDLVLNITDFYFSLLHNSIYIEYASLATNVEPRQATKKGAQEQIVDACYDEQIVPPALNMKFFY
jgi:hypothetical protein